MTKPLTQMSEREYFATIRRRLGMFVIGGRLAGLEAFLEGYDQHAKRHGGPGLRGWTEWLIARRGETCSHHWSGQVRHIALATWDHWELSADQEELVIDTLFTLLDEYLAEREAASTP
ncbi:hypothetical protein Nocox_22865 [Nonomuraea coxensis DSM 45129]|uniref:Uncharacterized protein n=1 Tax=Nonomuraea coxensis DSM 45129 TaxID=1122611 RepID=A0ABX8U6B0_9ACTN|nr:hypothetical protein [Nonomuraea coxensis]QYC42177.1 hypothetical protein Nocox_22865 [Nonomuraea coxensis DSM 45129]